MSFRNKIFVLLDVILRVPPLFIIDELFRLGLDVSQDHNFNVEDASNTSYNLIAEKIVNFHDASTNYEFYKIILLRAVFSSLGCVIATCVFMLWTRHLVVVYMYLISVGVVFVSYWANVSTMKSINLGMTTKGGSVLEDILSLNFDRILDQDGCFFILVQSYIVQGALAYLFLIVHLAPKYSILQNLLPVSFMAPSILGLLPLSSTVLQHVPVFSALLPLVVIIFALWIHAIPVLQTIYNGCLYAHNFIGNFGLDALVETEWIRLNVPCVLRTFWILRVSQQCGAILFNIYTKSDFPIETTMTLILTTVKSLLISGCETLTAVLGMTSIISYICHYIGCFFQWVLITEDDDDKSIGTVSAILFYILALQTGLTGLEPEKRFVRLCRNFCLLFTALLHFVHNIVNPLLMSLSASRNPSVHRHLRALLVCLFLILYPMSLLFYLWSNYAISTWLLAVSAFSIEVIVKVIVSLLIYSLFLIDAYCSSFWEKLDDYVYYIRAFGNTVEFCFGIFLFFNGAWILLFESGGAIRAGMMCIHAYFNIWSEARAGWNVFMKRRTAVNKIASLPEASDEQLNNLDDVCAICYQEMKTAKITRCNHFFHGVCLRKWLYVQDRCPLCHDILYKVESDVRQKDSNLPDPREPEDLLLIRPLPANNLAR